jgi:TPR repeat protein
VFKDGLSALSYSHPQHKPAEMADPDPGEPPDDEPMPIPSTWRQPAYRDDDKWYRHQMGAALLGLAAGLMIVVPVVLWMSGWLEPRKSKPGAVPPMAVAASTELRAAEVRTMKVQVRPMERPAEAAAQYVTGSIEPPRAAPEPSQAPEQASALAAKMADSQAAEARARLDGMLAQASKRVESGDVSGARELLAAAEEGGQGPATFALAETYDPNMLAAWGSRGIAADVAKAKALYRKALNLGIANAQNRLDALK